MEKILCIPLNDDTQEKLNKLDYFVMSTTGEISCESCLEDPEMLPQIYLPGYVAFAERLRFFKHPRPMVNPYVKILNIRGPILFRKIGKETPMEDIPEKRVIFHFDRIVRQTFTSAEGMIRPLPFIFSGTQLLKSIP